MVRTILITGTSSGIGKETALYFKEKGWNVIATMRHPESRNTDLHNKGLDLIHLDVTESNSIKKALEFSIQKYGKLDAIVNNAGFAVQGVFEAAKPDEIRKEFDTNVIGLMEVCRQVIPLFRQQKEGLIINVASVVGHMGFPYYSVYNSSKWAVEGFSESLQYELSAHNIRVKVIEPGIIITDFYDRSMLFTKGEATKVYESQYNKTSKRMHMFDSRGSHPRVIAELIYKAANNRSKRLRYHGGLGAGLLLGLRKILPDSLFFAIVKAGTL